MLHLISCLFSEIKFNSNYVNMIISTNLTISASNTHATNLISLFTILYFKMVPAPVYNINFISTQDFLKGEGDNGSHADYDEASHSFNQSIHGIQCDWDWFFRDFKNSKNGIIPFQHWEQCLPRTHLVTKESIYEKCVHLDKN